MENLTPAQVVAELDRYIVGQDRAKRAVAVALRNRWRRLQLPPELREEVAPKNIIMIGPTGVGKTEIARRLARMAKSPFLKVEASKFTEVGYVGRDVDSMVRDLVEIARNQVRQEKEEAVRERAAEAAEERLLDILLPAPPALKVAAVGGEPEEPSGGEHYRRTREKFRRYLREGRLDHREVEVESADKSFPAVEVVAGTNLEEMGINLREMMGNIFPQRSKSRKVKVPEALRILQQEEAQRLIDMDRVAQEAVERVEKSGVIFIDEIDKVAGRERGVGPDVSREGVQRDLLPIVEGSTVTTRYGPVRTDHVLFIASGAFHVSKPSDLIPELQGRFPIRVELDPLTREDFIRILTEPKNALVTQYTELLRTEGVEVSFTREAIEALAEVACRVNEKMENIGARRLHTVMERLLEEVSFRAPELRGQKVVVDAALVRERLADLAEDVDLSRYIL